MGITFFSESFANEYGLRNGIILSEICRYSTRENLYSKGICLNDISERLWFLSKDQLRDGLKQLKTAGLLFGQRKKGEFTREVSYFPDEKTVSKFQTEYTKGFNNLILK
jgi:hypothetical protein